MWSLLLVISGCVSALEPILWSASMGLDPDTRLSWALTGNDQGLLLQVEARTRGLVALGFFLRDETLTDADVMVAWVDDDSGQAILLECQRPSLDRGSYEYEMAGGSQNRTHTVVRLRLRRPPDDDCDSRNTAIANDTIIRIVWAVHKEDQKDKECKFPMEYKVWSGPKNVNLTITGQPQQTASRPDVRHWDVLLNNFSVPENMDTLYWCKIFKIPLLHQKHHIIGYDPMIGGGGSLVQHMVLYECAAMLEPYLGHPGAPCGSADMPAAWERCVTPTVAWTAKSTGGFLPDHVGLPMGEGKMSTYFMLEIYYYPTLLQVLDSSGLRLYYTDKLRQNEGAILVTGVVISPLQVIPPVQKKYKTVGYCDFHCTHSTLPSEIRVVSALLHSHRTGYKITLRHVRAGIELAPIVQDRVYDFNHHQSRVLEEEQMILPGDELITECVYDTTTRSIPTLGGYSKNQEMCLGFITYYPKSILASCLSMTPVDFFFETFGVNKFYHYNMSTIEQIFLRLSDNQIMKKTASTTPPSFPKLSPDADINAAINDEAISTLQKMADFSEDESTENNFFDNLIIEEPEEFRNRSFTDHLHRLPWTELLLTQTIETTIYKGKHMTFCRLFNDSLETPPKTFNFPVFTELPDRRKSSPVCPRRRNHTTPSPTSGTCKIAFNNKNWLVAISVSFIPILFNKV